MPGHDLVEQRSDRELLRRERRRWGVAIVDHRRGQLGIVIRENAAACQRREIGIVEDVGLPKVDNGRSAVTVDENIQIMYIAVRNVVAMQMGVGFGNLDAEAEEVPSRAGIAAKLFRGARRWNAG